MSEAQPPRGTLYLVPSPLDFGCAVQSPLEDVMPAATLRTAARLAWWICENAKSARAYLKRVDALVPLAQPLQALHMQEFPREVHKHGDHAGGFDASPLLAPALAGHDIGLISEAGMPAVADPGSSVVRAAYRAGITVVPLVGPGALLLAMAVSGMNGQSFAFAGYLPAEAVARDSRIRELEALALGSGQTQMFIETPYRNTAVLNALITRLKPSTSLSVCAGATLPGALNFGAPVSRWRNSPPDTAVALLFPAIYCIGK